MWSKMISTQHRCRSLTTRWMLQPLKPRPGVQQVVVRRSGNMIPPSQYDVPIPKRLCSLPYILTNYWELNPLFLVTFTAFGLLAFAIVWATQNKVDVVFQTHSCNNISRTMNLRKPTVHKLIIINQKYEPWPEMQDVLDKMHVAEHKAKLRAEKCTPPSCDAKSSEAKEVNDK